MVRIIPREAKFFDMFAEMAENMTEAAKLLTHVLNTVSVPEINAGVKKIKEHEHIGDEMTHAVLKKLNQTFITPFDREDIHKLASSLDDVLDFINAAAVRMSLYKIENPPAAAGKLAALIVRQSEELTKAVRLLEKQDHVMEHCVEINHLEDQADHICREAIASLFEHEKDPITLIKLKEVYEILEATIDSCEDVADVLQNVVVKNS